MSKEWHMVENITTMSGYTEPLTPKHCTDLTELYDSAKQVQDILNNAYIAIVEKYDDKIYELIKQGYKQGKFRDEVTRLVGKPYETWNLKGAKSRYWRMLISHIYQQYSSRCQRKQIIQTIKNGNYTQTCTELREDLRTQKLYPKDTELINIFKFLEKDKEQEFTITQVPLDYTTGDDHNVYQEINSDKVIVRFSLNRKQWFEIIYQIPPSIDQVITKITKPSFYFNDDGELMLKYAVETVIPVSQGENILGVDLGKIKKFSAASLSHNGVYSQELLPGKELEHNSLKESNLLRNKESNYTKKERIAALLKNQKTPDNTLVSKYEVLDKEYHSIRGKLSRLKDHSSWLTARDTTSHAVSEDCSRIHLEKLSWVSSDDNQGKWDYAVTQERIKHKSGKFGIFTETVNAAYTSWEYPEPYDENPVPLAVYDEKTRELVSVNGDRVDKDYAGAIAVAARYPLSKCKGKKSKGKSRKRAVQPVRCRDKNVPTPKRAKKKVLREFTQQEREMFLELLSGGVNTPGFVLSLPVSVVASGSVVRNEQLSFNGDCVLSGLSAHVT